ncbi:MAG: trimeric autotransporter adhesin, partial [Actinomycetota bacterium]|nr:trimeric autotransporter adhesin [Actinomycetota bacterium]
MYEPPGRAAAFTARVRAARRLPSSLGLRPGGRPLPGRLGRRPSSQRVLALLAGVALLAGGVAGALPRAAAAVNDAPDETWVANGDVNTVFSAGGRVYLGGDFDQVGPSTGSGVPLDPSTGALAATFPKVNGPVYTAVPDGAGGWYIGGSFTRVGDLSRQNAARVLADGTVGGWNPNTDLAVRAIVLARGPGANVAWIGGDFTVLNRSSAPVAAGGLAATNLFTGAALWGLPTPSTGSVLALTLSGDGSRLLAAGDFTALGGVLRSRLAAVDPVTGAIDAAFNPGADGAVRALATAPDGRVFAGGDFTRIAGRAQAHLAALAATGAADPAWQADADGPVDAVALSADGARLYAAGAFTRAGGAARRGLAALSTAGTGAVDPAWDPATTGGLAPVEIRAVALSTDGTRLYAGGGDDNDNPALLGAPRRLLVAVDASTGAVDLGFDPRPAAATMTLAASAGAVYAGGQFTSVNGRARHNLAALDAGTGVLDTGFVADTDGVVDAVVADGAGVYAGGVFSTVNGVTRRRLARLDPTTGAVAAAWQASASADVQSLALAGPRLYVGGTFTTLGGMPRNRLAAVTTDTGVVEPWNPNLDSGIHRIRLSPDQTLVYIAGDFTAVGPAPRSRLAAVDATTGLATGWFPRVAVPLTSLALSGDASLAFVATRGGNQTGNRLQAWNTATGALVWDRPGDGDFQAVDTSTSFVYTGGHFTTVAGQVRGHLAAFEQRTGAITAWAPTISGVHGVLDLQVTAGAILVAGQFHKVSGVVAQGIARFASDDPTTTTTGPGLPPTTAPPTTQPGGPPPTSAPPGVGVPPTTAPGGAGPASTRSGYWMVGAGGTVYAFGDAPWLGNAAVPAGASAVDLEPTPTGKGYWVVDGRGTVTPFGDAPRLGSVSGGLAAGETVTSLSATPTGRGYWIFTTRGRVLPFGDAVSYGDMAKVPLNGPVLDSIPTTTGRGYYMVAGDGGIFAFGDAHFQGSMGGKKLNAAVQSLVPDG